MGLPIKLILSEVKTMSIRIAIGSVVAAVVLSFAPIIGVAAPTETSVQTEVAVEAAQGFISKSKAALVGGFKQAKEIGVNTFGADGRVGKIKAQAREAAVKHAVAIVELEVEKDKAYAEMEAHYKARVAALEERLIASIQDAENGRLTQDIQLLQARKAITHLDLMLTDLEAYADVQ